MGSKFFSLFFFSTLFLSEVSAQDQNAFADTMPPVIYREKTQEKVIFLTFDDGPHPKMISRVLDILDKHAIKATFFILGSMGQKNKKLLKMMVEKGHMLANHSYSHENFAKLKTQKAEHEIDATQKMIENAGQKGPIYFRPPYGAGVKKCQKILASRSCKAIVMWSNDPLDWKKPQKPLLIKRVLETLKTGDILLLHDIHLNTIESLDTLLKEIKERGFRFLRIDEFKIDQEKESGLNKRP